MRCQRKRVCIYKKWFRSVGAKKTSTRDRFLSSESVTFIHILRFRCRELHLRFNPPRASLGWPKTANSSHHKRCQTKRVVYTKSGSKVYEQKNFYPRPISFQEKENDFRLLLTTMKLLHKSESCICALFERAEHCRMARKGAIRCGKSRSRSIV